MHSASALSNILEIAPNLSEVIVKNGGVNVLCDKMQNFEFIDIAENAIKTLEKISHNNSYAILHAGGLPILIKLIDFFVISVQVIFLFFLLFYYLQLHSNFEKKN